MSCAHCANKQLTLLVCTNCGTMIRLRHFKDSEPLEVAISQGKICQNCGAKEFRVLP